MTIIVSSKFFEILVLGKDIPGSSLSCIYLLGKVLLLTITEFLFFLEIHTCKSITFFLHMIKVNIDCEKSHRLDATLHGNSINFSTEQFYFLCKDIMHRSRYQDSYTILLSSSLESGSHIDIWRKIRGINLEHRTDGTFNGPALMDAKTHLDLISWHSIDQTLIFSVL